MDQKSAQAMDYASSETRSTISASDLPPVCIQYILNE
jgi:hypothetical protein